MPGCWQREEVPGQDDVPVCVLGTLWAAAAHVLLGQRPKKHEGHTGGTAVPETRTPAERDAEGGEKQPERGRDAARARSESSAAVVYWCRIGTARAGPRPAGSCVSQLGAASPCPEPAFEHRVQLPAGSLPLPWGARCTP